MMMMMREMERQTERRERSSCEFRLRMREKRCFNWHLTSLFFASLVSLWVSLLSSLVVRREFKYFSEVFDSLSNWCRNEAAGAAKKIFNYCKRLLSFSIPCLSFLNLHESIRIDLKSRIKMRKHDEEDFSKQWFAAVSHFTHSSSSSRFDSSHRDWLRVVWRVVYDTWCLWGLS